MARARAAIPASRVWPGHSRQVVIVALVVSQVWAGAVIQASVVSRAIRATAVQASAGFQVLVHLGSADSRGQASRATLVSLARVGIQDSQASVVSRAMRAVTAGFLEQAVIIPARPVSPASAASPAIPALRAQVVNQATVASHRRWRAPAGIQATVEQVASLVSVDGQATLALPDSVGGLATQVTSRE